MDSSQYYVLANRIKIIVQKYRAERNGKEKENYLKKIMDALVVGVIVVDQETKEIVDVNWKATTILNTPQEQALGKPITDFIPDSVLQKANSGYEGYSERVSVLMSKKGSSIICSNNRMQTDNNSYNIFTILDSSDLKRNLPNTETPMILRKSQK